jgi:hypothetical protein
MEDYYNKLLHLCVIIQHRLTNAYLWEMFKKGQHQKLRMAILSMPREIIIKMANSTMMMEQELIATKRKLVKEQDEFENEESVKESNDNGHQQSK